MVRKVTIAWFEGWKLEPENVEAFYALMEVGTEPGKPLRFRDACMALKVPYTLMHAHVMADEVLKARYDAVLAARADQLAHEALDDAESAVDRDTAAAARVKIEAKRWVAAKWDKERYGETLRVEKSVAVSVDAGLLGDMADLLKVPKREPRVLEHEPAELPEKVSSS